MMYLYLNKILFTLNIFFENVNNFGKKCTDETKAGKFTQHAKIYKKVLYRLRYYKKKQQQKLTKLTWYA